MKIELTDVKPVCYKPYRVPYHERKVMKKMIDEPMTADVIQPSNSEYVSLASKANGEKRLYKYYRQLNQARQIPCGHHG